MSGEDFDGGLIDLTAYIAWTAPPSTKREITVM